MRAFRGNALVDPLNPSRVRTLFFFVLIEVYDSVHNRRLISSYEKVRSIYRWADSISKNVRRFFGFNLSKFIPSFFFGSISKFFRENLRSHKSKGQAALIVRWIALNILSILWKHCTLLSTLHALGAVDKMHFRSRLSERNRETYLS